MSLKNINSDQNGTLPQGHVSTAYGRYRAIYDATTANTPQTNGLEDVLKAHVRRGFENLKISQEEINHMFGAPAAVTYSWSGPGGTKCGFSGDLSRTGDHTSSTTTSYGSAPAVITFSATDTSYHQDFAGNLSVDGIGRPVTGSKIDGVYVLD